MTVSSFEKRGRSTMSSSPTGNEISSELKIGVRAQVQGKVGVIRFVGTTHFQTGKWIGIELDDAQGKNSGVVQGKRYFDCKTNHGMFVRPSQVKVHQEEKPSSPTKLNSSIHQFAPMQDPNLAAARTVQLNTPSHSSTLLPSRISRLPQTSTSKSKKPIDETSRTPRLTSPTQKETKLQQIRLQQQQRLQKEQEEAAAQAKRREEEEEEEDNHQIEEKEDLKNDELDEQEELEEEEMVDQGESDQSEIEESNSVTYTDSNHVSRTSSTALPRGVGGTYPVYGSLAANLPVSKSEQMVPLKDYEELRLKLKILESKRQEDRERYREHEKVKEEAEQFLTLRNKLQDKISELQKELRETKRQLKETSSEQENYEIKYNDVIESLEMITLDKEVAEERAENLQQEVNLLKDKIEEISVDLDILKKEADIINRVPDKEGGEEKTPLEVIQLERHNERLKEALMKLRDAATARENELSERIRDLENDTYELEEVKAQFAKTRDKLHVTESAVDDLKELLDDALGAEDLVEQLTEKNLSLTEKLEEAHMVVEDLEALKELADELEENHIETEKQLEAEIDHRDMLLREQLERIRLAEETNADYEGTIQQFRELVMTLQNDLEQLRNKEVNQQSEKRTLSSQSQAMMSLNMQLQSTVMKAQAKSIDLELRKLDASQANDRLSYIQPYLPDSFFKTENDAISCVLLYKRLVFKSELIIKHLDQNHPISEKITSTVPENLVAVCEMRQRAGWLGDLSKRFVTFIENCQPMTFIKMGQVYHDLIGTERRLTSIVELLRTDEINETECVTELQRMIAQLEHLSDIHLSQNEANHVDQFFGLTRALDLNADRMTVELTFVRQIVSNASQNEDITITEGKERLDYDYLEPLGRLVVQAKKSKILSKKLLRQLEDLSEQALTLNSEYLHRFKTLYAISSKLGRFCYEAYKQITAYVNEKVGGKEQISLNLIQQIVYNKANEILEIAENTLWEGCLKTLKSLTTELATAFERIQDEHKTEKITSGTAPWIQRASDMKAEVVMNHDMERKLQQHSEEILKLIKDVKIKDQSLQESGVKIELLEKRMETVKKQADQIVILEETLQKTQDQEQMYAEAMENLQAEYDALEQENIKLKKSVSKKEEKRISLPKKSDFSLNESVALEIENINTNEVSSEAETLKAAIRYLRAENAHLKGSDLVRSLKMGSISTIVPHSQSNIKKEVENKMDKNNDEDVRSIIRSLALETRMLVKDIRATNATPKVVELSLNSRGPKWNRSCKLPDYQYQTQQSVLYTLNRRCEQLKQKMSYIQNHHVELTPVTPFEALKKETSMLPRSIAKIVLPTQSKGNNDTNNKRLIQLQSIKEFERIHTLFMR